MALAFLCTLLTVLAGLLLSPVAAVEEPLEAGGNGTIDCDVVIIGGGSSGTYTAVRLQAHGHSVALIEREDRLGGMVNTYLDPETEQTFDYGVILFADIPVTHNYFEYLNTSLVKASSFINDGTHEFIDFEAGEVVLPEDISLGNATEMLLAYRNVLMEWSGVSRGIGYHLPDPVPEDLLLSWGDFLAKYNLTNVAYTALSTAVGDGNILAQPALYMLKEFDQGELAGDLAGNFLTEATRDNQALYRAAHSKLASTHNRVLLNSNVKSIHRANHSVSVHLSSEQQDYNVTAKLLVIAIPPKIENLTPFLYDLTHQERELLSQFNNSFVWNGVITNTGIPSDANIENFNPLAAAGVPALPSTYAILPSGLDGIHAIYYGSTTSLTDEHVKSEMLATVMQVQNLLNVSSPDVQKGPELVGFHNHSPYLLTVSPQQIREGFYSKLYSLQGQQRTWWTGAAWESQDSAAIWNFTEYQVLPGILKDLNG